jgi:Cupin superfamily protein
LTRIALVRPATADQAPEPAEAEKLLDFDSQTARAKFGSEPFAMRHRLTDHPLFTLDALGDLADSLPADLIDHNLGAVPAVNPGGEAPRVDLTPGEIVRGIETNGCWIAIPRIESSPGYREVYEAIIDELAPLLPGGRDSVRNRHSVVFMSAPGGVTPVHVDPEHGLLLQFRGTKSVGIGSFPDEDRRERELERFFSGGHENIAELPEDAESFRLEPGIAMHIPPLVPHWVQNDSAVSISLSVGFRVPEIIRMGRAYSFNARLRRLGLDPTEPGRRPRLDGAKAAAMNAVGAVRRLVRR